MTNSIGTHIMVKPVGAFCNLNCTYCFYLEKECFYENTKLQVMSDEVLEKFIFEYIQMNDFPEVHFVWQGGEPMLAGLDFYKKVVQLQHKYANGKKILNSLQTNGVLINDDWCNFIKNNNFTVGISLDGPKKNTNIHRKDKNGKPMFDDIMNAISLLKKYSIKYTVLACVTRESCNNPLEVYDFFKENGIKHIQFSPIVERIPQNEEVKRGLKHSAPLHIDAKEVGEVTNWSVPRGKYGEFLMAIYDKWSDCDVGDMYVQNFEWSIASWLGLKSSVCIFSDDCSKSPIIEFNGDLYSCDHYMYPEYKIGNILNNTLKNILNSKNQKDFGCKKNNLNEKCKVCPALFACKGECPRHRFVWNEGFNEYESYLCQDYAKFFRHIHPKNKAMAQLISNGLPASDILKLKDGPIVLYKK